MLSKEIVIAVLRDLTKRCDAISPPVSSLPPTIVSSSTSTNGPAVTSPVPLDGTVISLSSPPTAVTVAAPLLHESTRSSSSIANTSMGSQSIATVAAESNGTPSVVNSSSSRSPKVAAAIAIRELCDIATRKMHSPCQTGTTSSFPALQVVGALLGALRTPSFRSNSKIMESCVTCLHHLLVTQTVHYRRTWKGSAGDDDGYVPTVEDDYGRCALELCLGCTACACCSCSYPRQSASVPASPTRDRPQELLCKSAAGMFTMFQGGVTGSSSEPTPIHATVTLGVNIMDTLLDVCIALVSASAPSGRREWDLNVLTSATPSQLLGKVFEVVAWCCTSSVTNVDVNDPQQWYDLTVDPTRHGYPLPLDDDDDACRSSSSCVTNSHIKAVRALLLRNPFALFGCRLTMWLELCHRVSVFTAALPGMISLLATASGIERNLVNFITKSFVTFASPSPFGPSIVKVIHRTGGSSDPNSGRISLIEDCQPSDPFRGAHIVGYNPLLATLLNPGATTASTVMQEDDSLLFVPATAPGIVTPPQGTMNIRIPLFDMTIVVKGLCNAAAKMVPTYGNASSAGVGEPFNAGDSLGWIQELPRPARSRLMSLRLLLQLFEALPEKLNSCDEHPCAHWVGIVLRSNTFEIMKAITRNLAAPSPFFSTAMDIVRALLCKMHFHVSEELHAVLNTMLYPLMASPVTSFLQKMAFLQMSRCVLREPSLVVSYFINYDANVNFDRGNRHGGMLECLLDTLTEMAFMDFSSVPAPLTSANSCDWSLTEEQSEILLIELVQVFHEFIAGLKRWVYVEEDPHVINSSGEARDATNKHEDETANGDQDSSLSASDTSSNPHDEDDDDEARTVSCPAYGNSRHSMEYHWKHVHCALHDKHLLREGCSRLNRDWRCGVKFLWERGVLRGLPPASISGRLVDETDTPFVVQLAHELADFLKMEPGVDRGVLCQIFERVTKDSFCASVLSAYLNTFDYRGQPIDVALRDTTCAFMSWDRPQFEAQVWDRIQSLFGAAYTSQNPTVISERDADVMAGVLLFLHTSIHNANVKGSNKMTMESFVRDGRACMERPFSEETMKEMYERVRSRRWALDAHHCTPQQQDATERHGQQFGRGRPCVLYQVEGPEPLVDLHVEDVVALLNEGADTHDDDEPAQKSEQEAVLLVSEQPLHAADAEAEGGDVMPTPSTSTDLPEVPLSEVILEVSPPPPVDECQGSSIDGGKHHVDPSPTTVDGEAEAGVEAVVESPRCTNGINPEGEKEEKEGDIDQSASFREMKPSDAPDAEILAPRAGSEVMSIEALPENEELTVVELGAPIDDSLRLAPSSVSSLSPRAAVSELATNEETSNAFSHPPPLLTGEATQRKDDVLSPPTVAPMRQSSVSPDSPAPPTVTTGSKSGRRTSNAVAAAAHCAQATSVTSVFESQFENYIDSAAAEAQRTRYKSDREQLYARLASHHLVRLESEHRRLFASHCIASEIRRQTVLANRSAAHAEAPYLVARYAQHVRPILERYYPHAAAVAYAGLMRLKHEPVLRLMVDMHQDLWDLSVAFCLDVSSLQHQVEQRIQSCLDNDLAFPMQSPGEGLRSSITAFWMQRV